MTHYTSIAMVRPCNHEGLIHVISLQDRAHNGRNVMTAHDIVVEGWTYLFDLNWAADGKGWYIGTRSDPAGSTFLYVDLKGRATVLQSEEGVEPTWTVRLRTDVTWPFPRPRSRKMPGCSKTSSFCHLSEVGAPT